MQKKPANNGGALLLNKRGIPWEVVRIKRIDPVSTDSPTHVRLLEMTYIAFDKQDVYEKLSVYDTPAPNILKAYILGVLHDATVRKYTYRVSQKSLEFVQQVAGFVKILGCKAWCYREGKQRDVFVVEFSKKVLDNFVISSSDEKIAYIRGYFDTEGSVPRDPNARYYIYFAQKDLPDLQELKSYLEELGIVCGNIHTPSIRKDPDYFRFYVLSKSHDCFAHLIGSWHSVKSKYIRMKI